MIVLSDDENNDASQAVHVPVQTTHAVQSDEMMLMMSMMLMITIIMLTNDDYRIWIY